MAGSVLGGSLGLEKTEGGKEKKVVSCMLACLEGLWGEGGEKGASKRPGAAPEP